MITKDRILKNCEGDRKLTIQLLGDALDIAEQFLRAQPRDPDRDLAILRLDAIYRDEVEE